MLTNEYERAAREHVPSSQAGYGSRRSTLEQILVLRLAQQQAKIKGTDLYIGFQDYSCYFMKCIHEITHEITRATGVDPAVDAVMKELHTEVTGKYETYWGLTQGFKIRRGLGQGCVAAATRSKIVGAVTQKAISKIAKGISFTAAEGSVPVLSFADDQTFTSSDHNSLQLAYDTSYIIAKICGLSIKIKTGKQGQNLGTAYMATRHVNGKSHDIPGKIILPNGQRIPQILAGTPSDAPKKAKYNRKRNHTHNDTTPHNHHTITRRYKYLGEVFTPSATH